MVSTDVEGFAASIPQLPVMEDAFVCSNCFLIHTTNTCPICGATDLPKMCPHDNHTREKCIHHTGTIAFCPECGKPMCPICHSHDVAQISRVTGYLSSVEGWNAGKQQELKDRKRTDI